MRTALGLPQDAQLPEDIKGSYVNIGGEPTLIFKKDGKTLDQTGLREYVQNLKQGSEAQQVQEQDTVTPSDQQTETVNTDSSSTPELHTPQMDTQVFDQPPVYRGLETPELHTPQIDTQVFDQPPVYSGHETPELHTPQIDTQVFDQPPVYRGFETPEQQANLNHVLQDGYQVVQQDGGMILSKDGKNYQINPNGTLGAEIKADAPAPAPETKEAPQTEDKPKQNIPAESDKPHKLTKEEINENINNLKPGESYSYSLTTSNPMGSTKAPVTWTRNDDGTLTRTRKEANFSNKSFDTLKTVYSEDRSRVISQDTQELMFGAQVVVSNQYDESGNVTSKSIDMQDLMNSQRGRMMLTSDLTNPITKKADKYAEQTFKNTDGEVLVTYKDGQWFNDEGKEISDSKAYKIMDKARKEQTIGELVQIPIEG